MQTLRRTLREALRREHEELDRIASTFDLTAREGFLAFLRMQFWGLGGLIELSASPGTRSTILDLHARATHDLAAWKSVPRESGHTVERAHPVAVDYIVGGARLGNTVIRKRWQRGNLGASAYFAALDHFEPWQAFLKDAEGISPDSAEAAAIVADAQALFRHFTSCALKAQRDLRVSYA